MLDLCTLYTNKTGFDTSTSLENSFKRLKTYVNMFVAGDGCGRREEFDFKIWKKKKKKPVSFSFSTFVFLLVTYLQQVRIN